MSMKIKTLTENMMDYCVNLNGLLVPVRSAESIFQRYTVPLVVWNNCEIYSCSPIGSGTAIYYKNKYLVLFTRHQLRLLGDRTHEDIGLLDKDGKYFCSSNGIQHFLNEIN